MELTCQKRFLSYQQRADSCGQCGGLSRRCASDYMSYMMECELRNSGLLKEDILTG